MCIRDSNGGGCAAKSRRNRMGKTTARRADCDGSRAPQRNGATADPVSYTHLDVYKRQILQQTVDYSFMTIESIMKSFGHTVKLDIIKELFKRDLTISQLSRALHVSRSSIGRYVDDLLEELTLTRIRKIGPEIYLHLNMEYIKRAKTIFNDFIDQLTLESDDVKGGEI